MNPPPPFQEKANQNKTKQKNLQQNQITIYQQSETWITYSIIITDAYHSLVDNDC